VKDFGWWSSLTRADILRGLDLVGDRLRPDDLDGVRVWGPAGGDADAGPTPRTPPAVHLVQAYDEYIVGYTQTKYVLDLSGSTKNRPTDVTVRNHVLLIDGQVAGRWRRTLTRGSAIIEVTLDRPWDPPLAAKLLRGVMLDGKRAKLERVYPLKPMLVRVVLRQGINRQIRRMFYEIGYEVKRLVRTRIGNLRLGDLPRGHWRPLTKAELRSLDPVS